MHTACHKQDVSPMLETLRDIQKIGADDPCLAIAKIDSLDEEINAESEYVRMKSELLRARMRNLADSMPESTKSIKRLIKYFTKHGNLKEQQEVFYMAGSIYRDLQDAPTAIDHFLKSEAIAIHSSEGCDSALLYSTYSNLSFLYSYVANFPSELEYSKKEYKLALATNDLFPTTIEHLANSYQNCDSTAQALQCYDMAYRTQLDEDNQNLEILSSLLYAFVNNGRTEKADSCIELIRNLLYKQKVQPISDSQYAMGYYYQMKGNTDSALVYYKKVLAMNGRIDDMYNASKALYEIHAEQGDLKEAIKYAKVFVAVNDTLTLGKKQEEVATVNNWYKYMRDKEEEKRIQEENEAYQAKIIKIAVISIIAALVAIVLFLLYRDRQRSKINRQNEIIRSIGQEKENQEKQLHRTQQELQKAKQADAEVREQLTQVNKELKENKKELKIKKDALSLMHRTRTKANAEAYIKELRAKSKRKEMLSSDDWNQLYDAVDEQWPELSELISENVKTKVEDRKKICYMKKAGFSDLQIEFQTGISRSTIIRFLKQNTWMK